MSAEDRFSRAAFLMGQSRYDMAEAELRKALLDDPDDAATHACLAICIAQRGRFEEALAEAQAAVRLAPDDSFSFYALACTHIERERWTQAEAAIVEAIRLNPFDESNFAVLARVLLEQKKWQAALDAAEQGLNIDPEHVTCLNSRAMALRQLGQADTAGQSLQSAMQHEPEDAYTHCNVGWGHLQAGNREQAMIHFREALRLEPEMDSAREGMLDVLRSRNVVYRLLLPVLFWLSRQNQWLVFGVGAAIFIVLQRLINASPALGVWLRPVLYLLMACCWLTYIAEPLMNLLVRASREGRQFLSQNDIQKANWCAVFIVPGLVFFAFALIFSSDIYFLPAVTLMSLVLVVAEVFDTRNSWVRTRLIVYAGCIVVLGMVALLLFLYVPNLPESVRPLARQVRLPLLIISMLGCLVAEELANWLTRNAPHRE